MIKFPTLTISLSLATIGLFLLFGETPPTLIWQSNQLELWQLISSHFVHISIQHLLWNIIAFIILGSIIEQHSSRRLILTLAMGCTAVNLYLFSLFDLPAYAGLSGVLNSLLVVALYQISKLPEYNTAAWLSLIASVSKLLYEWHTGTTLLTSLAWPSVPEAHFVGLIGGFTLCFLFARNTKIDNNTEHCLHS